MRDQAPLLNDLASLGAAGMAVSDLAVERPAESDARLRVGVHRDGTLPPIDPETFDILLTASPIASAPWVSCASVDAEVRRLEAVVARQPAAAAAATQVFRSSLRLPIGEALAGESIAYSMLLASSGFQAWRESTPMRAPGDADASRVRVEADDDIRITLTRPARRNAFDAAMRDALCEALTFALEHPDAPAVVLSGEGPSFSSGGDLDEFGSADDPALAHLVRVFRSPARLVHELGARLTVHVGGPCVGAGIEVPAAAARIIAAPGSTFRLPEVAMGLIPGAGGTVSIPRRIGRHRACWMAISGAEIDLATALVWGLVDEVAA